MQIDSEQRHTLQVGQFPYIYAEDRLIEEWLLPSAAPANSKTSTVQLADGTEVFANPYQAIQWWSDAGRKIFKYNDLQKKRPGNPSPQAATIRADYIALQEDLRARIAVIEVGHYPKNPGDHCRYCPVHLDCLGIEP